MPVDDNEAGQFRETLIRRKREWAAEGCLLTGTRPDAGRLLPGQREVKT